MAVTYGFYNALNHDRLYDAIQMSSIFDGIIRDGIFSTIGDTMIVTAPEDGMYVNVGSGRAWFNHTWTLNDTAYPIEAEQAEVVLDRIDAVILEVNSSAEVRANSIKFLKGTPSSNPVKPTLTHNAEVNQYALAYVRIRAGQTTIFQSDIENAVGTDETPFITGVLQQVSIETLLKQWEAEFNTYFTNFQNTSTTEFNNWLATKVSEYTAWFAQMQTDMDSNFDEFDAWFQRMKDQLSEDAAGHLQAQIDALSEAAKKGSVVTITTTDPTLFGKNVTISKTGFDPVTSSFNSAGVAYFETVPMVGDVSIEATNGTLTAHGSLNIPYFGRYSTTLEFWEAILDISTDIESLYNRQITIKKNSSTVGTTTFDSTGHATFSVHSVGTYNVSATDNLSKTYEADVDVTEETTYTVEFIDTINGSTVEPTDDITTWLKCVNIEDPSITTLADVLANRSLFETLIANSNACNYMARSTTWSGSDAGIVNSQDAISLIGKYDYCSNALLSNATWAEAIGNSENFEEVLNASVPKMTSNTAPSGEAFASADSTNAYKAFNNNTSDFWGSNVTSSASIGYKFLNKVIVRYIQVKNRTDGGKTSPKNIIVQGSNDGTNWSNIVNHTNENTVDGGGWHIYVNSSTAYKYWRLNITSLNSQYLNIAELQFYGRKSTSEDHTNIIHSAANDTIYMMKDGSPSVLTTTDSNGVGTLDFTQFDDGVTYKLYSSVAKDPNNLSNDYSKDIRITKNKYGCTTEAYLMPDAVKTLYWYGYEYKDEGIGVAINPEATNATVTKNTNNILMNAAYSNTCGIHTIEKQTVNSNTKIKAIYNFESTENLGYTSIFIGSSDNYNVNRGTNPTMVDQATNTNSNQNINKQIITCNSTHSGKYYIRIVDRANGNVPYVIVSEINVYALWLE